MTDRQIRPLAERVPEGGSSDPDEVLDLFLGWVADIGFDLYPAQEEAILELLAGHHVILATPTGSGKSLVALALHFKGMCEGRTSFYTSPIKALASEKFFSLCADLGPENVSMRTGDATINPDVAVTCCTAEILANMSLRQGSLLAAPYVVMDEFHYYSDPDRGVAWQIPLITQEATQFLLMSATLGDTSAIEKQLSERTGRTVAVVSSDERPVPLDYSYRETPIHETVEDLLGAGLAPVYIVNFTQRDCADLAQNLTSMGVADRELRRRIAGEIGGFRFDSPYGRDLRRFLGFGVGVHHAGLLPKYRLLVEQLSQKGLLRVVCGTDTLGVGVNIPIRTVLFSKLAKYDGRRVGILSARDFKQIGGRAGRKGFDERGSVVCQAPEQVIEKMRRERKAGDNARKRQKAKKAAPRKGEVSWTRETFDALVTRPPETMKSRFRVTHGMILNLLQRDAELDDPDLRNFGSLRELIAGCHDPEGARAKHLSRAAMLVRSLYRAGVIRMARDQATDYLWVVLNQDLQWDFSLHHSLSLYLVEALTALDTDTDAYALDVVSLAEAVLEDPYLILRRQVDKLKTDLLARLKAEGVTYEERMARLDEVTAPQPLGDFINATFATFRRFHPWVGAYDVSPKSVGREMYESYASFGDYVRAYGLQRSEGLLLRYLSQLYKTLIQNVPAWARTEAVYDVISFLRTMLERVDTSLLQEWESMRHPELRVEGPEEARATHRQLQLEELLSDPKVFRTRLRAELHQLVRALAARDWEDALAAVRADVDEPWDGERFEAALAPFFDEFGEIAFDHRARLAEHTVIREAGQQRWDVDQVLVDPAGDNMWAIQAHVDLTSAERLDGPLVELIRIGT